MANLRGILAGFGLERSGMHAGSDDHHDDNWITRPRFEPVEGGHYLLAFSRIPAQGEPPVIKRIRVDGPTVEDWIDLDEQRPLDRALYAYAVKAWRPLKEDDRQTGSLH
ncbi:MAG TPA: hypothetical protein VM406_15195 [Noviherbaspirillum sp.]|nr:hypothetical protein [Noviherbaspirillum sp.]